MVKNLCGSRRGGAFTSRLEVIEAPTLRLPQLRSMPTEGQSAPPRVITHSDQGMQLVSVYSLVTSRADESWSDLGVGVMKSH